MGKKLAKTAKTKKQAKKTKVASKQTVNISSKSTVNSNIDTTKKVQTTTTTVRSKKKENIKAGVKQSVASPSSNKSATNTNNKKSKRISSKIDKQSTTSNLVSLIVSQNGCVVDPKVPGSGNYIVAHDEMKRFNAEGYDATLNYSDVKNNNNKFYKIQLLQDKINTNQYKLFVNWGRTGSIGGVNLFVTFDIKL